MTPRLVDSMGPVPKDYDAISTGTCLASHNEAGLSTEDFVFFGTPTSAIPDLEKPDLAVADLLPAIPAPGNTYMIVNKAARKAVTCSDGHSLVLQEIGAKSDGFAQQWLCVEHNGFFGFCNPRRGRYIGLNSEKRISAKALMIESSECFTPRMQPEGGYQPPPPSKGVKLMVLVVAENGQGLERRHHGKTLWEFVKVGG